MFFRPHTAISFFSPTQVPFVTKTPGGILFARSLLSHRETPAPKLSPPDEKTGQTFSVTLVSRTVKNTLDVSKKAQGCQKGCRLTRSRPTARETRSIGDGSTLEPLF